MLPPVQKVTNAKTVCILGAGSYGTAMAFVAGRQGHRVKLWMRNEETARTAQATRFNPKRFQKNKLPDSVAVTSDLKDALNGADIIMHCIPAQHTPGFVRKIASILPAGVPYVSTAKGIHVASHMLMSEAIPDALGEHRNRVPVAYLSGPSFAKEMVMGHPIGVVIASYAKGDGTKPPEPVTAIHVQSVLNSDRFRVYVSDDVIGVEVGGALKNPLAIGAGMASGCGFGQSTVALIVTRGCREMRMLALALGGRPETLAGLSGVGDLMITCFSSLSRNNRCGRALAEGKTVSQIMKEMGEVVEGVPTAAEIVSLAKKHNLRLPIFTAVNDILSGRRQVAHAFKALVEGKPGMETFH